MKLRVPSGRLSAWVLCAVAALATGHPLHSATASGSKPPGSPGAGQPPACKPLPPVRVELEPGAAPDLWRVRLEAIAPAADVEVSIGADATRRVVWRGAVAQGESRSFDVRFAVPMASTAVRAEASIATAPQAIVRAIAVVPVVGGKPVAAQAAAAVSAGRVVVDPKNGEAVLELPGEIGGRR